LRPELVDDCAERLVVKCVVGGERAAERRAADVVGVEERREDVEELLDLLLAVGSPAVAGAEAAVGVAQELHADDLGREAGKWHALRGADEQLELDCALVEQRPA